MKEDNVFLMGNNHGRNLGWQVFSLFYDFYIVLNIINMFGNTVTILWNYIMGLVWTHKCADSLSINVL